MENNQTFQPYRCKAPLSLVHPVQMLETLLQPYFQMFGKFTVLKGAAYPEQLLRIFAGSGSHLDSSRNSIPGLMMDGRWWDLPSLFGWCSGGGREGVC